MAQLLPNPPRQLGLAVSGGSDSTALLHLTARWAEPRGIELFALTVDHGQRAEAADEAAEVARQCNRLGVAHSTLTWAGWDGQGNFQDTARRARHVLVERWRGGLGHILLGHTKDDQAETVLMRLGRGSGVEGLSGMAPRSWILPPEDARVQVSEAEGTAPPRDTARAPGFQALRPLLGFRRNDLRDWLRSQGVMWSEDPSNADDRYERVRARQALGSGQGGLSVEGLAETANRMARARDALARRAQSAAQAISRIRGGDVVFDRLGLEALDADTRLRLVAHALMWIASADYRPREAALTRALAQAMADQTTTLHGCLLIATPENIHICREFNALAGQSVPADPGQRWDRRWLVAKGVGAGLSVQALGDAGLAQIADLPEAAPPHPARRAAPGLWRGSELVAAPTLGIGDPSHLLLRPPKGDFTASLVLH